MFDPTSAPKVTQPTLRRFIDFCRSRGKARYQWFDRNSCAGCQFFESEGVECDWLLKNEIVRQVEGVNINALAYGGDIDVVKTAAEREEQSKFWTFDQLAERAERELEVHAYTMAD